MNPVVGVDGRAATVASLEPFAVVNDGHLSAMQVRDGAVRGLRLHLARLVTSHKTLYGTDLDADRLRALLRAAIADYPDAYLRVTVAEFEQRKPTVMTVVRDPIEVDPAPVSLMPVHWTRGVPEVKHVGSFPQIHYGRHANAAGYDDAVLIAADGRVCETTVANIAFVAADHVVWPDAAALPGVTWQLLERALPAHDLSTEHDAVRLGDLDRFDGAVVMNSIGVAPVASIGAHRFSGSARVADRLDAIYRSVPAEPI